MKTIYKAGIAIIALLLAAYVAFSAVIFFDRDSGNSNERWVQAAASPGPAASLAAVSLASLPDLPAIYSAIMKSVEAGEFEKVIAMASLAIEKYPQDATLPYFRGFANLQKKGFDEAVRDLSTALERAPTNADAYRFRAQAYIATGQVDRAIADADKACELQPENADSYIVRVMAYVTKGDLERAKPDIAKILQLDPNNAKAKILEQQLQASAKAAASAPSQ